MKHVNMFFTWLICIRVYRSYMQNFLSWVCALEKKNCGHKLESLGQRWRWHIFSTALNSDWLYQASISHWRSKYRTLTHLTSDYTRMVLNEEWYSRATESLVGAGEQLISASTPAAFDSVIHPFTGGNNCKQRLAPLDAVFVAFRTDHLTLQSIFYHKLGRLAFLCPHLDCAIYGQNLKLLVKFKTTSIWRGTSLTCNFI
jgi:hypothetical protein